MNLSRWIRARLFREPIHECTFCGLTFTDGRQVCPACGFGVERA